MGYAEIMEGNQRKKGKSLLKKYGELGYSMSAMGQKDTPEQKKIICQLIDLVPGEVYLDWDRKYVSKDEAKKYIMNYGKESVSRTVVQNR